VAEEDTGPKAIAGRQNQQGSVQLGESLTLGNGNRVREKVSVRDLYQARISSRSGGSHQRSQIAQLARYGGNDLRRLIQSMHDGNAGGGQLRYCSFLLDPDCFRASRFQKQIGLIDELRLVHRDGH
jgi:hypothetical protein